MPFSLPSHRMFLGLLLGLDVALLALYLGHTGHKDPTALMREGKFITHLSAVQLGAVAVFSLLVYKARRFVSGRAALLWLAIAAGFIFLTIDELAQFHENLDKWIHKGLNMKPNSITTRLDDFIIFLYGVIGAGILWANRNELKSYRALLPWLLSGFALLVASVSIDMFTHRTDAIRVFVSDMHQAYAILYWLKPLEEVCKILAEAVFAGTFYAAWRQAAQDIQVSTNQSEG